MDKEIYARALSLLSEDKTQEALDLLESVEDKDAEGTISAVAYIWLKIGLTRAVNSLK